MVCPVRELDVFGNYVAIKVGHQGRLRSWVTADPERVLFSEDQDMPEDAALDVGQERLAAFPVLQFVDVAGAEVVQERGPVAASHFDQRTVRDVEHRCAECRGPILLSQIRRHSACIPFDIWSFGHSAA